MTTERSSVRLEAKSPATEHPAAKPIAALIVIRGSLGIGLLLVWVVNLDWVLEITAGIVLLADVAVGIVVGRLVYRFTSPRMYQWVRVTAAAILGLSVVISLGELEQSHKLIRYYDHYSSDHESD